MILTPKILARIVAIVLLGVLLQLSFFSRVELLHTSPDVLPALVVALALLGGGMAGAVIGFSVGLLAATLVGEALGLSSLVLLTTGYLAGIYRERADVSGVLVPALLCMGFTVFAEVGYAVMQLVLGVDASISALVLRDLLLKGIYAFFLGAPIYVGVRRLLRPALVEDRAVRRSSQPTVLGT